MWALSVQIANLLTQNEEELGTTKRANTCSTVAKTVDIGLKGR